MRARAFHLALASKPNWYKGFLLYTIDSRIQPSHFQGIFYSFIFVFAFIVCIPTWLYLVIFKDSDRISGQEYGHGVQEGSINGFFLT